MKVLWSQAQQAEHSQQGGEHTDMGHRHSHCLAEQCHGWSDSCSSIPAQAVPGKLGAAKAGWVCVQRQLLSTGLVVPSLRHPHVQHHSLESCSLQPWSFMALEESSCVLAPLRIQTVMNELVWEMLDMERMESISREEQVDSSHGRHTYYLLSSVWHVKGASTYRRENAFQSVTFSLQYSELKMH